MMSKRFVQQVVSVTFVVLCLIVGNTIQTHATEVSATPTPTPTPTATPTPVPPTPTPEQQGQSENYEVTITGRIVKSGIKGGIMVMVVVTDEKGEGGSLKIGDDGKLLNPTTSTDSTGKFKIVADRRFWEKTGTFSLVVSYTTLQGSYQNIIRNTDDTPIVIKVDKNAKEVELEDIMVK